MYTKKNENIIPEWSSREKTAQRDTEEASRTTEPAWSLHYGTSGQCNTKRRQWMTDKRLHSNNRKRYKNDYIGFVLGCWRHVTDRERTKERLSSHICNSHKKNTIKSEYTTTTNNNKNNFKLNYFLCVCGQTKSGHANDIGFSSLLLCNGIPLLLFLMLVIVVGIMCVSSRRLLCSRQNRTQKWQEPAQWTC